MECRTAEHGRAEVSRSGSADSISLPESLVFRFDDDLEQQLNQAFEAGDQSQLDRLWASAQKLEPELATP